MSEASPDSHSSKVNLLRRAREREKSLLGAFNKAAWDVTEWDRCERENLLGAFAGREETEAGPKGFASR